MAEGDDVGPFLLLICFTFGYELSLVRRDTRRKRGLSRDLMSDSFVFISSLSFLDVIFSYRIYSLLPVFGPEVERI